MIHVCPYPQILAVERHIPSMSSTRQWPSMSKSESILPERITSDSLSKEQDMTTWEGKVSSSSSAPRCLAYKRILLICPFAGPLHQIPSRSGRITCEALSSTPPFNLRDEILRLTQLPSQLQQGSRLETSIQRRQRSTRLSSDPLLQPLGSVAISLVVATAPSARYMDLGRTKSWN